MAFWESYSPIKEEKSNLVTEKTDGEKIDEIKEWHKSNLVTEKTDGEKTDGEETDEIKEWHESNLVTEKTGGEETDGEGTEIIETSTNRDGDRVVVDTTTPETENTETEKTQKASEKDPEANSLRKFNWNKKLAEIEANRIIKENLPYVIEHLDEEGKRALADAIEKSIAESGVDLPIEIIPGSWTKTLENYQEVAKKKAYLTEEQRGALEKAEIAAVESMEEEAKKEALAGIVREQIFWKRVRTESWEQGGTNPWEVESNPWDTSWGEWNAEWWNLY